MNPRKEKMTVPAKIDVQELTVHTIRASWWWCWGEDQCARVHRRSGHLSVDDHHIHHCHPCNNLHHHRHCLCHDHLVDIVVILVVGAKSHNGTQAETVWEENLKNDYHHDDHYDDHYDDHHDYHFDMMTILIRMIMPIRCFIRLRSNLPCKQILSHRKRR